MGDAYSENAALEAEHDAAQGARSRVVRVLKIPTGWRVHGALEHSERDRKRGEVRLLVDIGPPER